MAGIIAGFIGFTILIVIAFFLIAYLAELNHKGNGQKFIDFFGIGTNWNKKK